MNKEQREIFRVLAEEVDFDLCAFCKFSECISGGSPCDCGEPYCIHPLGDTLGEYEHGMDCWGFKKAHPVAFCADIVGEILQKGWHTATWWQDRKGQWRITGSTSRS